MTYRSQATADPDHDHHDTSNLTRAEAEERARLIRVRDYRVELDLTGQGQRFTSRATIRFSCTQPGAGTFIDLVDGQITGIEVNGSPLDPTQVYDGTARIHLPELAEHNTVTIEAECRYMNTGEGLHRFADPVDAATYLYTQFEVADARRVFACFDQPDLKAVFTFTVHTPAGWQVVSNSPTPTPQVAGEVATWRFEPTEVLPTYITAIVAGPYHRVNETYTSRDGREIPLSLLIRASMSDFLDPEELFAITKSGMAYFEEAFGRGLPFRSYDQAFVPEFNAGAMENAGAVTYAESSVFRSAVPDAAHERRAATMLHEMAHMWFGDLVTMRWWNDLWLNESFAEYASTVAVAEATRWTSAWARFATATKSWGYRQDQLTSTHPVVAPVRDLADVLVNFDGITYAKGASVLKQLVAWVGREQFDTGIRRYFDAHAWGNTTLTDLLHHLEQASGRDLQQWSAQWLQTAGVNTLTPHVQVGPDGTITGLSIEQSAPDEHPHLRSHRLAVGGYTLDGGVLARTWREELDVTGEQTAVPAVTGRPMPDLLLINDDDLTYAKIRLDPRSLATAMKHLGVIDRPLPRALVWSATWDMLRDAELPATEFVELVLSNLAAETDSSVLLTVLRQLSAAVGSFVPAEHRAPMSARVGDRLRELAAQAPPGSDHQLQLVTFAAAHADSPGTAQWARDLLDGITSLDGLTVDTDLRWSLVTGLAAAGFIDAGAIETELNRDRTASGQLRARRARSALPTREAKHCAWEEIRGGELPNAAHEATIAGFGTVTDPQVLAEFVRPYFDSLKDIWQERTYEMAEQFVVGMYPRQLAGEDLLQLTDSWLAEHQDASPALLRLVTEGRDTARRAAAAQQVWDGI